MVDIIKLVHEVVMKRIWDNKDSFIGILSLRIIRSARVGASDRVLKPNLERTEEANRVLNVNKLNIGAFKIIWAYIKCSY